MEVRQEMEIREIQDNIEYFIELHSEHFGVEWFDKSIKEGNGVNPKYIGKDVIQFLRQYDDDGVFNDVGAEEEAIISESGSRVMETFEQTMNQYKYDVSNRVFYVMCNQKEEFYDWYVDNRTEREVAINDVSDEDIKEYFSDDDVITDICDTVDRHITVTEDIVRAEMQVNMEDACNYIKDYASRQESTVYVSNIDDIGFEVGDTFEMGERVDVGNREQPFVYLDGKIYWGDKGKTHAQFLNELLVSEGKEAMEEKWYRPTDEDMEKHFEEKPYGFGHYNNVQAWIQTETLTGCNEDEVVQALLNQDDELVQEIYTLDGRSGKCTRVAFAM